MVPFKERNLENSAFNNFPWVGWFVARPRWFCCLQARQGCLQVVSKVIPKLPQVWLFASKTDCLQVVSNLFQIYPKVVTRFGCLQARQVVLSPTSHLTRVSTSLRRPPRWIHYANIVYRQKLSSVLLAVKKTHFGRRGRLSARGNLDTPPTVSSWAEDA